MRPPIDFHTHLFSYPYFEALARQSPAPGETREKIERAAKAAGIDAPPQDLSAHVARWVGEMDRHGVRHAVTFASAPEEIPAVAEAAAMAKGRLSPFALLNPKAEGAAARVRDLLAARGAPGAAFRGILLFPAMHHFRVSEPAVAPVLEAVAERGAVAVVQCGILQVRVRDLLGIPRRFDLSYANPLDVIPAADAFGGARFVIPHFGAGFFREALMAGTQCENVFLDTSSSNSWMLTQEAARTLADVYDRALDVFGPTRLLFGTDSSTFPRGWRADVFEAQREALDACHVPAADQDRIFSGNAERLLGLS